MYASRHAVFIGPGRLPDELRLALSRRAGSPQPDVASQAPRLLAQVESAAEAERVAAQLQRLRLGVAVAGPEQPPAELGWSVATHLEPLGSGWRVVTAGGEARPLDLAELSGVTLLDWRPREGTADRAALLRFGDQRPVMVRASALDAVSRHALPLEGLRRLDELLTAAARTLRPGARVRVRRMSEAELQGDDAPLAPDLLPLALAVIDAVDTLPGALPQPLQGPAPRAADRPARWTRLAASAAWLLYGLSLAGLGLSLALLTLAAVTFGARLALAGLTLGVWATRRFMWSRWLALAAWGARGPVPRWPIATSEGGLAPRGRELALDGAALLTLGLAALGDGLPRLVALGALPLLGLGALASAAAVFEAWERT